MNGFDACLTFDIDFLRDDECDNFFTDVVPAVKKFANARATLFLRIDDQLAARFDRSDHLLRRYETELAALLADGWEIGWHPHCYARMADGWRQNLDEPSILADLRRNGPIAREWGMSSARMGWSFHTQATLMAMVEMGFTADSSAMPRPRYEWEESVKDWEGTPDLPYRPSRADYRRPGLPALDIIELPLSVGAIAAPYDKGTVIRYLNVAYKPAVLAEPLRRWVQDHDSAVLIAHPAELIAGAGAHALMSYNVDAMRQNLDVLAATVAQKGRRLAWKTVRELADQAAQTPGQVLRA